MLDCVPYETRELKSEKLLFNTGGIFAMVYTLQEYEEKPLQITAITGDLNKPEKVLPEHISTGFL